MKNIPAHVQKQMALNMGFPLCIIQWRVRHGWPIEHMGAKEFPYGENKVNPEAAIYSGGTKVRITKKRRSKICNNNDGSGRNSKQP